MKSFCLECLKRSSRGDASRRRLLFLRSHGPYVSVPRVVDKYIDRYILLKYKYINKYIYILVSKFHKVSLDVMLFGFLGRFGFL